MMCTVSCYSEDIRKNDQADGLTYVIKTFVKSQLITLREELNIGFAHTEQSAVTTNNILKAYMDDKFASALDQVRETIQSQQQKDIKEDRSSR